MIGGSAARPQALQDSHIPRGSPPLKQGKQNVDLQQLGSGLLLMSVPLARCHQRALYHRRRLRVSRSSSASILGMLTSDQVDSWAEEEEWLESFDEDLQRGIEESRDRHLQALNAGRAAGHEPVLLVPTMQWLFPPHCLANADDELSVRSGNALFAGLYVDCTFGRGGYSREILSRLSEDARLVALDVDPTCVQAGRLLEEEDSRFCFLSRSFGELEQLFSKEGAELADLMKEVGRPQGMVFDVGVSSVQVDDKSRGFNMSNLSRSADTRLDLRMNPDSGPSAAEWLEGASVEEIAWVLREYGDDFQDDLEAERIAQLIYDDQQANGPFHSMQRFAELVGQAKVVGDEEFEHTIRGKRHPARLTVQALRLWLNSELEELREGLEAAFRVLDYGGRCLVTTFKRKEEMVVRRFISSLEDPDEATVARIKKKRRLVELYPLCGTDLDYSVRLVSLPLKPALGEVSMNSRARSGSLYVLEKAPRTCPRVRVKPRRPKNRFHEPVRTPVI